MKQLRDRRALLTGASRGLGTNIAEALAREGAHLVLAARSAEGLSETAARLAPFGVRVESVPTDLADPGSRAALIEHVEASGGVDVLINNAGLDQVQLYHEVDPELLDRIIAVNLNAPMQLTRALLPGMIARQRGHVVNIASVVGLVGAPYNETYAATKHGLMGFSRSLRMTLASEGHPIGVSAICPGLVTDRGMYTQLAGEAGDAPRSLGGTTTDAVARAVVRAIVSDIDEVIVNSMQGRSLRILDVLFPRATDRFMTMMGATAYYRHAAQSRREHRAQALDDPAPGDG